MNIRDTVTGNTNLSQMISQVVDRFDRDRDGKLSTDEFGSFLNNLLGSAALGSAARGSASTGPMPAGLAAGPGQFRHSLAGFDFTKLDNPNVPGGGTMKYTAARIFQHHSPQPESLPSVINELRAQGINATQVSFDKIDFGDGYGPVDVIQGAYPGGGVAWQWAPGA